MAGQEHRSRVLGSEARSACRVGGYGGHRARVPVQPRTLQVDEVAEDARRPLQPGVVHQTHRVGLAVEKLPVGVVPDADHEGLGALAEDLDQVRVEVGAGAPAHLGGCGISVGRAEQHRRGGHVHQARRQGDVCSGSVRVSRAVPHREHVREPALHRGRQAQPPGCVLGDVTRGRRPVSIDRPAVRQRPEEHSAAPLARGRSQAGDPCPQHLGRVGGVREEGEPGGRHVVTERLRQLMGVCRAAQVLQQGGVEGGPDLLVRAPGGSRETGGDEAALQRLLHRGGPRRRDREVRAVQQPEQPEHNTTVPPSPTSDNGPSRR